MQIKHQRSLGFFICLVGDDKIIMTEAINGDIQFTVPGDPVVKGRPRFTKYGKAYTPKATLDAEKAIKKIVENQGITPFDEPVGMEVAFFCQTKRRTDGDNLMKLVLDACNEVAYTDDYLVEEVRYRVFRRAEGEEPRTEVLIYPLGTD